MVALLPLVLAACAGLPVEPPSPKQKGSDSFVARGRIGVLTTDEKFFGKFRWWHGSTDRLDLADPLGQVVARIETSAAGATLTVQDGREYHADDVETLTRQVLGWYLPVAGMADWIVGRPQTGHSHVWKAADTLEQDGWTITFGDREGGRPAKIIMNRVGLEVRIRVDAMEAP